MLDRLFGRNKKTDEAIVGRDVIDVVSEETIDDVIDYEPDFHEIDRIDAELAEAKAEIARLRQEQAASTAMLAPSELGVVVNTNIVNPEIPALAEAIPADCERAGKYRVTFKWPETPGGSAFLDLTSVLHKDSPLLDTMKPYVGPLCAHELDFLQSEPGAKYNPNWAFRVTPVVEKAKKTTTSSSAGKKK